MYEAFDTAEVITDPEQIINAGYTAVGVYAREDRCPFAMSQGLIAAGVKLWTIWEKGNPTSVDYFTQQQAREDTDLFLAWAKMTGQPQGSPVFACVDFDADWAAVKDYIYLFHDAVKAEGFLFGVYGSGGVCQAFKEAGYAHYTWLAQSTGWQNYQEWAPHADIRQGPSGTALGYNVDFDVVVNPAVLW